MLLLIGFAFLAGIVTVLSPCILPVLPIVLSSAVDDSGKKRPLGVVIGFVASFTFFTLFLSTLVKISGIPADSLRFVAIVIVGFLGLSLLVPQIQLWIEQAFSKLTSLAPQGQKYHGFGRGFLIGLSLGLLWTPCVGPILASVISLAIVGTVTAEAFFITLAYSLGTAIPMFIIMMVGATALQKVPWLLRNTALIQKGFGVVMVATAIGIFFNVDRAFQTWVLESFPQYGVGLTKIEDNEAVRNELQNKREVKIDEDMLGKPSSEMSVPKGPQAPELIYGGEWINSEPLTMEVLRGKVVLVDFWTYSCINCQRTFPYLKAWWEKYKDKGLVIIGVHAPEFEFEKNIANVKKASIDFNLTYPIMQDNDFATWRAYQNNYWPDKYLVDKDGLIRYYHFGEGEYDQTERVIQKLLEETGSNVATMSVSNAEYDNYARTPETYLGYGRMNSYASLEDIAPDALSTYTVAKPLPYNSFAFGGSWTVREEFSAPEKGSELELNFNAKEVFIVARPKQGLASMQVLLDGVTTDLSPDAKQGSITVDSDKLYHVLSLPEPGEHTLTIKFPEGNIEVYAFTFG
jgi:cytochrome c biogenesis protein CcdA/thiol-disulfide isomerase/thioredoxin